jgi:hypothetical protein
MAYVRGTVNVLGVFLVVAVSMECDFIAEFFSSSYSNSQKD